MHIPLLLLDNGQPEEALMAVASNTSIPSEISFSVTLSNYAVPVMFIIRLLGLMSIDATLSLLDASGMAMSRKFDGDFGRQKMWSMLCIGTIPLLTGFIIDMVSHDLGKNF